MVKRFITVLLLTLVSAPIWAQAPQGCPNKDACSFAPKKGQWEFSLVLGKGSNFYNENTSSYLLPTYTPNSGSIGLPNGGTTQSGDLNNYLQIDGFNNNSLVNIVGIQAKYFFQDCWAVNFSLGFNINLQPKKDYVEALTDEWENLRIPDQQYINAQATNDWYVNVGFDRYFRTPNPRINPYLGATVGFQMARIETTKPYTGQYVYSSDLEEEVPEEVYQAGGKAGVMMGLKVGAVAGIEYALTPGLYLGLECQPLAYRYDIIQIAPQGYDKYNTCHHNIKIVDMPVLKLGFRF